MKQALSVYESSIFPVAPPLSHSMSPKTRIAPPQSHEIVVTKNGRSFDQEWQGFAQPGGGQLQRMALPLTARTLRWSSVSRIRFLPSLSIRALIWAF